MINIVVNFVAIMYMTKNMKNMDEDDLAMLMQFKRATCPYFSYGDEYRIARKQ